MFTALKRPVRLVYHESFSALDKAVRRELQIKRWRRAKKEALIRGDCELLRALSNNRIS